MYGAQVEEGVGGGGGRRRRKEEEEEEEEANLVSSWRRRSLFVFNDTIFVLNDT